MSDTAPAGTDTADAPHGDKADETGATTPTVEELAAKVEALTAESRKWEGRAKANKDAADELDALKREKMTDAERAEADRTAAAEHLATLTSERDDAIVERDKAIAELARYKIAVEFELSAEDTEALSAVNDEATLRALAERLAGRSPSGPKPNPAQGRGGKPAPSSPADAFAAALEDLF